ncbi:MAG: hypothetical protein GY711_17405 [bacterium]|nr:hypothetical protein [bacterium]
MNKSIQTICVLVLLSCGCRSSAATSSLTFDSLLAVTESPIVAELDEPADYPYFHEPATSDELEADEAPLIGDDSVRTFEFRDMPLAEAIHLIAADAGINIYLNAGMDERIDASFPGVTTHDALRAILGRNGLALAEEPEGIFWVQRADGTQPGMSRFSLRSINAADVEEQVRALVGDRATVVFDTNQNVVLVHGSQNDVELVAAYLDVADQLKPQVLVEVNIFEARIDERFELGFEHLGDTDVDGDALTLMQNLRGPSSAFELTLEGSHLTSTLAALRRYVGIELISSPRVMSITNTESSIEVVEEIPYVNVTSTTETDAGGVSVLEEVQFKEAGIKLKVTPTVQEAGILQIDIDQEFSEVVDVFNNIPVLDSRHLVSHFLVSDRQTIVLGGLMHDASRDVNEGVPGLMHVPLLGRLFSRDEDTNEKRELLIFLTPRILDPHEAARMAKKYQSSYRGHRNDVMRRLGRGDQEE